MKYKLILSLVIISIQITYSQIVPEIQWIKFYDGIGHLNDFVNDMCMDKNNNFYMAGRSTEINGAQAFFIIKYNQSGDSLFTVRYVSAPMSWNEVNSIAVDQDANIYAIGRATFGQTSSDGVFFKYDSNGTVIWQKRYYSGQSGIVKLDNENNPIIVVNNGNDAVIIKYSTTGDSLWSSQLKDDTSYYSLGNILIDSIGNTFATLLQPYWNGGDFPDSRTFLIKINSNGNILWRKLIYAPSPVKLIFDNDSNLILTCQNNIMKLTTNGDSIWNYHNYAISTDVLIDSKNNIVISGYSGGIGGMDYLTNKISSDGIELWYQEFNSDENLRDFASCVAIDKEDNIYISGGSNAVISNGYCYTLRYSPGGQLQWKQKFKASHSLSTGANNIFLDDSNNVFLGGECTDSTNGSNYLLIKIKQTDKTGVTNENKNIFFSFGLDQNYPNPFNPSTTLNYSLPKAGNVKLNIYNILGSKVATILNEYKPSGNYSVQFNGSNLASGIYLYRLESGNYSETKKMILIK